MMKEHNKLIKSILIENERDFNKETIDFSKKIRSLFESEGFSKIGRESGSKVVPISINSGNIFDNAFTIDLKTIKAKDKPNNYDLEIRFKPVYFYLDSDSPVKFTPEFINFRISGFSRKLDGKEVVYNVDSMYSNISDYRSDLGRFYNKVLVAIRAYRRKFKNL